MRLLLPFLSLLLLFYACSSSNGDKDPASEKPKEKSVEEMLIGDWEQMGDSTNLNMSPMFYEDGMMFISYSDDIFDWEVISDTLILTSEEQTQDLEFIIISITDSNLILEVIEDYLADSIAYYNRSENSVYRLQFNKIRSNDKHKFNEIGGYYSLNKSFDSYRLCFYLKNDTLYCNRQFNEDTLPSFVTILNKESMERIYHQFNFFNNPHQEVDLYADPGWYNSFGIIIPENKTIYPRHFMSSDFNFKIEESYLARGLLYHALRSNTESDIKYFNFGLFKMLNEFIAPEIPEEEPLNSF